MAGDIYGLVFGGESSSAQFVLDMLRVTRDDFYRYRDAFISFDGEYAVYTRAGGGNQSLVPPEVKALIVNHPLFLRREDDSYDNTYCTYYFSRPDGVLDNQMPREESRAVLWEKAMNSLKSGSPDPDMMDRATQALSGLIDKIKSAPSGTALGVFDSDFLGGKRTDAIQVVKSDEIPPELSGRLHTIDVGVPPDDAKDDDFWTSD